MKPKVLLFITLMSFTTSFGQQLLPTGKPERIDSIRSYLKNDKKNVPGYILDSLIIGYQKGLSGSSVKDGKVAATSLTVTEKGASLQVTFAGKKGFFFGINASGSGTDKFVSVVKDGRYQNNFSAGVVMQFFPASAKGRFYPSNAAQTKIIVQEDLNALDTVKKPDRFNATDDSVYINQQIKILHDYEDSLKKFLDLSKNNTAKQDQNKMVDLIPIPLTASAILNARTARDTLIALGILPKKYPGIENVNERIKAIPPAIKSTTPLREKKFLAKAEKELMNAKWNNISLWWFTLKPNINVAPYKMVNPEKPDDHFADTYNDYFFSLAGSVNWTWRNMNKSQFQFTVSPTGTIGNPRDFSALSEQTIVKTEEISIDGIQVDHVLWTTTGYQEKPERKLAWNIELPLIFFWNKYNFGVEIVPRVGENNPYKNNVGGKLGIFIPIEIKDGSPIWIEPLVKVGKLFNKVEVKAGEDPPSFWKDNFEFGFNLAVSVPAFKAFKK